MLLAINGQRSATVGEMSLDGKVAVVAGATRGAGRDNEASDYNRPETIEETAETLATTGSRCSTTWSKSP